MKKRIFIGLIMISLLTGLLFTLVVGAVLPISAQRRVIDSLQQEAAFIRARTPEEGISTDFFNRLITDSRVTWIAADGHVHFDQPADAQAMENHADRPEFIQALSQGRGTAVRYSSTLGQDMMYYALRLEDGSVLRLAAPVQVTHLLFSDMLPWLGVCLAVCLIGALVIARLLTGDLSRAIARINLDTPEEVDTFEELSPLLTRISQQNQRGREQLDALAQKQQEMDKLIDSMSEGFMVLDARRRILTINRSAAAMLEVDPHDALGKTLPEISRKPEILQLLQQMDSTGEASVTMPWDLKIYALNASVVEGSEGAVLLLGDVTERIEGENMRKRFTANVSHELRTPLTTICGYSEMLQSGMVKPGDEKEFYARISSESKRLLALVEDILRLSQMDEGYPGGLYKRVSLWDTAREALSSLQPMADKKDVRLNLLGEKLSIMGDPTLLSELMFNLVDNAIKYNRIGGHVDVTIRQGREGIDLVVQDNGIGIERGQQDKIFERFYRTDKSRSKETGGTGLGLSIVKHSAEYHRASLTVDSEPGLGTTIIVTFPRSQPAETTDKSDKKKKSADKKSADAPKKGKKDKSGQ